MTASRSNPKQMALTAIAIPTKAITAIADREPMTEKEVTAIPGLIAMAAASDLVISATINTVAAMTTQAPGTTTTPALGIMVAEAAWSTMESPRDCMIPF